MMLSSVAGALFLMRNNAMIRVLVCDRAARLAAVGCAFLAFAGAASAGDAASPAKSKPRTDRCVAMYGPGFVTVEGTEACIKIGGHIRVEGGVSSHSRAAPAWNGSSMRGLGTTAGVDVDTRAETEIGTVRGVLRLRGGRGGDLADPFR